MAEYTFEPTILEQVKVSVLDEEYSLPAIKHPHIEPTTSILAVVIKLHHRVQELETKLAIYEVRNDCNET